MGYIPHKYYIPHKPTTRQSRLKYGWLTVMRSVHTCCAHFDSKCGCTNFDLLTRPEEMSLVTRETPVKLHQAPLY